MIHALGSLTEQRDGWLTNDHLRLAANSVGERLGKRAAARDEAAVGAHIGPIHIDHDEARTSQQRSHRRGHPLVGDAAMVADDHVVGVGGVGDCQTEAFDL